MSLCLSRLSPPQAVPAPSVSCSGSSCSSCSFSSFPPGFTSTFHPSPSCSSSSPLPAPDLICRQAGEPRCHPVTLYFWEHRAQSKTLPDHTTDLLDRLRMRKSRGKTQVLTWLLWLLFPSPSFYVESEREEQRKRDGEGERFLIEGGPGSFLLFTVFFFVARWPGQTQMPNANANANGNGLIGWKYLKRYFY